MEKGTKITSVEKVDDKYIENAINPKEFNLNREEMHHIILIMEERGVEHCKFCKELLENLKENFK